jgi:hypothetical protein
MVYSPTPFTVYSVKLPHTFRSILTHLFRFFSSDIIYMWSIQWLLFNTTRSILQPYHGENKLHSTKWWWRVSALYWIITVLKVGYYCAILLKQTVWDRHVAPLGHIIPIPSRPVVVLIPYCCMLRRETAICTNFMVFGSSWQRLDPTIYHTRHELWTRSCEIIQKSLLFKINEFQGGGGGVYTNIFN